MSKWKSIFGAAAILAVVQAAAPANAGSGDAPTVVELFTSQGFYSCPAAEAFLTELADKEDLVALEWHVDYWDELVYGYAGKWKDPFSSRDNTHRQQIYNQSIRGQGGVYTPQMIIGGRLEAVGSQRGSVQTAIQRTRAEAPAKLGVTIIPKADKGMVVHVDGKDARPASIWLIRYDHAHTTVVKSGENKGKTLTSRNIVRGVERVGAWKGRSTKVELASLSLAENQGCAILVQGEKPNRHGPILGAANCPR